MRRLLLLAPLLLASCTSIMVLDSVPQGATVKDDKGRFLGVTPVALEVPNCFRRFPRNYHFILDGYAVGTAWVAPAVHEGPITMSYWPGRVVQKLEKNETALDSGK